MRSLHRTIAAGAVLTLVALRPAIGHVTLETRQAPADSYYKAVLKVGHGCAGSPTIRIRVQIPDGVLSAKPQPKPGWELVVDSADLPQPVRNSYGKTITETVREVTWSGRLPDEHYDEFVVSLKLPNRPGTVLYLPTVQECEAGAHRWVEIPGPGRSAAQYKEPAPGVTLTAKR